MKRREKWPCVWLVLVLFLVLLSSVSVRAEEKNVITDATQTASGETQQKAKTDQMVDQIADELLEELELDCSGLTSLKGLEGMIKLKKLRLQIDAGLQDFSALKGLTAIEEFNVYNNSNNNPCCCAACVISPARP